LTVELALVKLCQLGVAQNIPTAAPQPQAQPASAPQPKPAAAPQSQAQPTSAPQPAVATAQIPKMPNVGLSFGPKKQEPANNAEGANAQTPTTTPAEEPNRPFTDDQLKDAWVGLAQTYKDEPRLKQLIENYIPQLKGEWIAEIQMPNPWQMEQIRKAMPALAQRMRTVLHNSELKIQLVQQQYTQEQMAFTAEEKFQVMAEQNPALAQLKERLDLQID